MKHFYTSSVSLQLCVTYLRMELPHLCRVQWYMAQAECSTSYTVAAHVSQQYCSLFPHEAGFFMIKQEATQKDVH